MIAEASRRGCSVIFLASYSFQAPGLYERCGFERLAEFADFPPGHTNVILRRRLSRECVSVPVRLDRPVEAVCFDMDGLLIDSERVVRERDAGSMAVAGQHGRPRCQPRRSFLRMVGRSAAGSRAVALDHFGADFDIEEYDAEVEKRVENELGPAALLKLGVKELLDELNSKHVPCAVVTSSSHATVARHLGRNGVLDRFQTVVAAGDYANGKPDPDPYVEAARRFDVDPRCCLALEGTPTTA